MRMILSIPLNRIHEDTDVILQPSVCSVQLLDPIDEDDPGLLSFNVVETLETYVPERGDAI